MQVRVVPGEPNAETALEMIARLPDGLAHYRLRPATGRTHQLRVQMDALGAPIAGDRIYPRLLPEPAPGAAPDWSSPLQLLARAFGFVDPVTGQTRHFVSARTLALAGVTAGLPR
jgi:tRNA pseudouridine32 synthase / 23S rRNA pseudouridine746 synthase